MTDGKTVGATIQWCVHANDTSNNWNSTSCVSPFSYVTTEAPTDTCSPSSPLTSDHTYACSDRCNVTSALNAGGFNILINGTGTFTTTANITNVGNITIKGTDSSNICEVYCLEGGCFV